MKFWAEALHEKHPTPGWQSSLPDRRRAPHSPHHARVLSGTFCQPGYEREWDTMAVGGSRAELDEIARRGHLALARSMRSLTVT